MPAKARGALHVESSAAPTPLGARRLPPADCGPRFSNATAGCVLLWGAKGSTSSVAAAVGCNQVKTRRKCRSGSDLARYRGGTRVPLTRRTYRSSSVRFPATQPAVSTVVKPQPVRALIEPVRWAFMGRKHSIGLGETGAIATRPLPPIRMISPHHCDGRHCPQGRYR